jgi:outer membrane receptor protein involved in Fe transport
MARYLLLLLSCLLLGSAASAQTSLRGKVTDGETGEALIFANVVLEKNGVFIAGQQTDFDGNYSIPNIDPGNYDLKVSSIGYGTQLVENVRVNAGQANFVDVKLNPGITMDVIEVVEYKVPLIEQDKTTTGGTVTAEEIARLPSKNINAIAANVAGTSSADEGDAVTIKGSRSNATNYYIDGIRVSGNLIPQTEIEQLQVITGGIEAQYGDVTGGIISITTKGPSSRFSGGFELESSYGLDPYGYLLGMANLSGPIIKNKEGKSILGFRVSGQYINREDDDPPAIPVYQINEERLAELEANPITQIGSTFTPSAAFMTFDDVNELNARPNEENTRLDLTGKLDLRISDNIDFSVTGTYNYQRDFFTPNYGSSTAANAGWGVFNSHNNPFDLDNRYRIIGRLRHRLGGNNVATNAEGEEQQGKGALIQNATYWLQAGYERRQYELGDPTHGQNFFDYGHIGSFGLTYNPAFEFDVLSGQFQHVDYTETLSSYDASNSRNPVLSNYNNVVDLTDIGPGTAPLIENGFTPTLYSEVWDLHANVGTVYNLYRKRDQETLTLTANSSFELVPKNSEGRHNIQFGVWFEQRTNRGYDLNPRSLWLIGRQQSNRNINGLDTTNVIGDTILFGNLVPIYGLESNDLEDLSFYREVRDVAGVALDEFVNVDELNPDDLRLDMFSAFELTNAGILNYWGYDYLGNENDTQWDDFFTARDENGTRTFPVAADRPIYGAAYIQDKFTFKDIIIRAGLRVDYFDANTRVLKDPYSLYEIQNAQDFHNNVGTDRPSTIQDDFKVYVESEGSDVVKAYRDGDQWYFANGTEANDGSLIFGTELAFPRYTVENPNIQDRDFDPNVSFQDYEQQINLMPRLAFSFPISENANFFAHYDILVQRPPSNNLATPLTYYYFQERTGIFNNPNLRPERTIDYEVGFQQKLSATSALKIAAYYKELRDMIQARTFLYVAQPINQYETFDNLDFGTVKGFTFQYDLRRTGNVSMQAAYTLQFADGTGSDAQSSRGLSNQGIQRVLFPLNFDERHRINVSLDYRYGSGKRYNGPRLFGLDILANAGVNLQAIAVSGRPYTARLIPDVLGGSTTVGSINGSRRPWNFTLNARVDKDFYLVKPGEGRNPLSFNIYLRVSNVFDARNIVNVYSATGSPEDDGYLQSPRGLDAVQSASAISLDGYVSSYQWRMLNPTFFSLPRRIFVGGIFSF